MKVLTFSRNVTLDVKHGEFGIELKVFFKTVENWQCTVFMFNLFKPKSKAVTVKISRSEAFALHTALNVLQDIDERELERSGRDVAKILDTWPVDQWPKNLVRMYVCIGWIDKLNDYPESITFDDVRDCEALVAVIEDLNGMASKHAMFEGCQTKDGDMEKFGTYLASIKPVISRIKAKAGLKEGSMHKRPSSGTNPVQQTREITIGHPEALAVLSRVND